MSWSTTKDRPIKKKITEGLFLHIKHTNPDYVFKCFFCLPSTRATDVEEALKRGVIDKDTKIIAIERDPKHLLKLKLRLTRLGFGPNSRVVINKDLCDLTTYELATACKELGVEGVDLFYIDTCNCLVDCVQDWIQDVACNEMVALTNSVLIVNVQGARATHDLDKYPNEDLHGSSNNINPWANKIAQCLSAKTQRNTCLTVGYKEPSNGNRGCGGSPMVLCVCHPATPDGPITMANSSYFAWEMQNSGYKEYELYKPRGFSYACAVNDWFCKNFA